MRLDEAAHLKLGDLLLEKQQHSAALQHYELLANVGIAEAHHRMAVTLLPPHSATPTAQMLLLARRHIDIAVEGGVVIPTTTRERLAEGERLLAEARKSESFFNPYLTAGVVVLVGIVALEFRRSLMK